MIYKNNPSAHRTALFTIDASGRSHAESYGRICRRNRKSIISLMKNSLKLAEEKIARLSELAEQIGAEDMHELLFAYELKERLLVCRVLIEHLKNRKETRWHSFNENLDHPETDEKFEKYVNSRMEDGKLHILFRDLVKGDDL